MLERRIQKNPDVLKDLKELLKRPGFESKTLQQTKEALKQKISLYGDLKKAYDRELEAVSKKDGPKTRKTGGSDGTNGRDYA